MTDIDPRLSPLICAALEPVLTRDWNQTLTCVDVSGEQLRWDIEARDLSGTAVVKVSFTRAPWVEALKASAESEDVRSELLAAIADEQLRDLAVSLHLHSVPTHKGGRRQFGASLAPYVRSAAERLRHAPFGHGIDVRQMAEVLKDPRTFQLRTTLNSFEVYKIALNGPLVVTVNDERTCRWTPPAVDVAMPRLEDKLERHGIDAPDMVLLIEIGDADASPACIAQLRASLTERHLAFRALYVCTRDHGLEYRITLLYCNATLERGSTADAAPGATSAVHRPTV